MMELRRQSISSQAPEVIKGIYKLTAPQEQDDVIALRRAVDNADWSAFFAERKTRTLASASWSASEERCEQLRSLCVSTGAKRVLEIGSFVGVSALSMAQVLPDNGEVVTLEIDPFAVDFALDIKSESAAFWKINHMIGPAWETLQSLVQQMEEADGAWQPFDLAVIDADKAGMMEYFQILTEIPGMMTDNCVICVDVKLFKGQLSTQKADKNESWLISSGQSQIDAFREFVAASGDFEFHEHAGLLQICKKLSLTMAKNPFASFRNCYSHKSGDANWAAPQEGLTLISELRKEVNTADWARLYEDGCTKVLASASWSSSEERCEKLQALCKSSGAKRILEIGSFCGVASLVMAEALPDGGQILSLEIDPFLVNFGQEIKRNCHVSHKISHMVGPAQESLQTLVRQAEEQAETWTPFDLVVIDADKTLMMEYFRMLWGTPGMLTPSARVCVDVVPFRCQLFARYVKGKIDDFIIKSGQESIDEFGIFVKSLSDVASMDVSRENGLVVLQRSQ